MDEKISKQVETSPKLERKRAKYTVEDVRQLCGGISRSTVMREIRRKRLACYRARRTLRFSEEHITKYLERVEHASRIDEGRNVSEKTFTDGTCDALECLDERYLPQQRATERLEGHSIREIHSRLLRSEVEALERNREASK